MSERPSSLFKSKLAQLNTPDPSIAIAKKLAEKARVSEEKRLIDIFENRVAPLLTSQSNFLAKDPICKNLYQLCKETALAIYDRENEKRPPFYKTVEVEDFEELFLVKNKFTSINEAKLGIAQEIDKKSISPEQLKVAKKFRFLKEMGPASYHYVSFEAGRVDDYLIWGFGQSGSPLQFEKAKFKSYGKNGVCKITPRNLIKLAEIFAVSVFDRSYAFERYPEQDNEVGVGSMGP